MAQVAFELNAENITIVLGIVTGLGAGLGIPIFFVQQVGLLRSKKRARGGVIGGLGGQESLKHFVPASTSLNNSSFPGSAAPVSPV